MSASGGLLRLGFVLGLGALSSLAPALGCAGSQAYVDWRSGLSASDFDGTFEIERGEYEEFAAAATPNTMLDRTRGEQRSEAGAIMSEVGARLAKSSLADPHGYAIADLDEAGHVSLSNGGESRIEGEVDWLAATADRSWVALLSGRRLSVALGDASTGIDLGSLLGNTVAGYRFMMLIEDAELTIFALPEIGGAVTAYEPGYVFSFNYRPGSKQIWEISAARVTVTM